MNDILSQYDLSLLPPDLVLDQNHPANDAYIASTQHIQKMIVAQSAQMRPKEVETTKLAHQGMNQTEIGQRLSISPATVGKTLRKEPPQRLRALLSHYDAAIEGPHRAQRKAMLWRIARANEADDPRVAISALSELGKGDDQPSDLLSKGGTTQIIINTQQLPRGALDGDFEVIDQ